MECSICGKHTHNTMDCDLFCDQHSEELDTICSRCGFRLGDHCNEYHKDMPLRCPKTILVYEDDPKKTFTPK